jgi:hypothetical protein
MLSNHFSGPGAPVIMFNVEQTPSVCSDRLLDRPEIPFPRRVRDMAFRRIRPLLRHFIAGVIGALKCQRHRWITPPF